MKFFTTEWYGQMQASGLSAGLKGCRDAEKYDDALYEREYEKWISEMLGYQKEISEMSFAELFPEPVASDMKYLPQEVIDAVKAEYRDSLPEYRRMYEERPAYDEEALRAQFAEQARLHLENLKKQLPEEILSEVADLRLLAIDVASPKVKKLITAYSDKCRRHVERVFKDYDKFYKSIEKKMPEALRSDDFCLHDAKILSARLDGDKYYMEFDPDACYSKLEGIEFSGVTSVKGDPAGCFWLYDEEDVTENGYYLGVLCYRDDDSTDAFEIEFGSVKAEK